MSLTLHGTLSDLRWTLVLVSILSKPLHRAAPTARPLELCVICEWRVDTSESVSLCGFERAISVLPLQVPWCTAHAHSPTQARSQSAAGKQTYLPGTASQTKRMRRVPLCCIFNGEEDDSRKKDASSVTKPVKNIRYTVIWRVRVDGRGGRTSFSTCSGETSVDICAWCIAALLRKWVLLVSFSE